MKNWWPNARMDFYSTLFTLFSFLFEIVNCWLIFFLKKKLHGRPISITFVPNIIKCNPMTQQRAISPTHKREKADCFDQSWELLF